MAKPLKDGHIHIEGNGSNYYNENGDPSPFDQEFHNDSLRTEFWQMVHQTLSNNRFGVVDSIGFEVDGEKLFHFTKSEDFGYFRFLRSDPTGESYTGPDLVQIRKDLNTIFEDFEELKGLIIDVRLHRGGYPEFSFEVAGRFTDKKILGRFTQSRISGGAYDEFDSLKGHYVDPDQVYATSKFLKPIVLLTNEGVGSAGEVFVMAMDQMAHVTSVGTNTAGIFSFMYEFNLPNEWWCSLSNSRTLSPDQQLYEGTGIPPDIIVQNTRKDLASQSDPVVMKALEILNEQTQ